MLVRRLARAMAMLVALGASLALLGLASVPALGEDDDEGGGGSLGDLFDRVKDLKIPDSVTSLPDQLTELKDAYLKTAETVEQLRGEVDRLSEEVAALKSDNAELRRALETKQVTDDLTQAAQVTSEQLIEAYQGDRSAADAKFKGRYVKVSGPVAQIESGTQEIFVFLRGRDPSGPLVRCEVKRDANFHVDVLAAQGRIVSRNDRSTVLAVGQPVTVTGTCEGAELNVNIANGRVEGVSVRRVTSD